MKNEVRSIAIWYTDFMIGRVKLTKTKLAVWLLAALTVPWQFGGKQPVAVLIDMILIALAAFLLWRSGEVEFPVLRGWAWITLVLLGWAGLSLVWSVNRYQTIVWLEVMGLSVAVFWLATAFGKNRQLRVAWLNGYQVVATAAATWGLIIYLTQSYDRLTSSFYLPNPWAAYVLPAFLLSSWRYAKTGKRLNLVCAPILGMALVLADSRSAFLILVVAAMVGLISGIDRKRWGRIVLLAGGSLVLVGGANLSRHYVFHQTTLTQGARFGEAVKGESTSASDRIYYLKSSLAIWRDYPVLGTGAGTYGSVHPKYQYRVISASTNAHNFYAQTLSELGAVGLALVAIIFVALIRAAVGCFRTRKGRAIALVLALMLLHLALDVDASYPSIMVIVGVLAGFTLSGIGKEHEGAGWRKAGLWAVGLALVGCLPAAGVYLSDISLQAATQAQSDGDYWLAGDLYAKAHSGWTYDPDVVSAEGIIRYRLAGLEKDKTKAKAGYEQAKSLALQAHNQDPFDPQHVFLYARATYKEHDIAQAEAAYKRTIKLDPYNHPESYVDLAYLYLLNQEPAKVLSTVDAVLPMYPDSVIANRSIQPDLKGYLGALRYFRALVESDNKPNEAKKDAQAALKLNPANEAAKELLTKLTAS